MEEVSERSLRIATAEGGPIDGQRVAVRKAYGVLVIDKPAARAWVYDFSGDFNTLKCRDAAGEELDNASRFKAADDGHYDILSIETGGVK